MVAGGYESRMLGLGDRLSDAQIGAILDYIKSTWPKRECAYQQEVTGRNKPEKSNFREHPPTGRLLFL